RRQVPAALLVVDVVPAGPVRAGEAQLELLLVEQGAAGLDRHVPDDDDSPAVARELRRELNGVRRGRGSADEHGVEAELPRGLSNARRERGVVAPLGAADAASQLDRALVEVDPEGVTTR